MIKLIKYLKGSVPSILAIICLLVLQAWCDLELPNYTSRIVTQGIQQKGVEDAVPERLSAESMRRLKLLLNEESAGILENSYTKEEASEGEDTVYRLLITDSEARAELSSRISSAEMLLSMLTSPDGMEGYASMLGNDEEGESGTTAGSFQIPENAIDLMALMPAASRENMLSEIDERLAAIPDTTKEQAAILFVQSEYESLGEDLGSRQNAYLVSVGLRMLGLALIAMISTILVSFLACRMAARFSHDVRSDVYQKVISFHNEEFHHFSTASLITRSTNDVQQVQMFLAMGLRMILYAPILGIGGIIKVIHTDVSMSWTIALAVGAIMILIVFLFAVAMPKFTILQTLIDRLNLVTREQLTGVMVTRAFSAEQHEEERFETANDTLTRTNLFVNRCMTFMMPAMMLIMNGVSVLIVYAGAHAIDGGAMQVGDMMAFIQYAMQIIMSFLMISMMSIIIPRANVAANRIAEVLGTQVRMQEAEVTKTPAAEVKGQVEFDHVSFAYPDAEENVLTDISFTAKRGETVAFIGSTGSGKSTLVNLIPRFYDVTAGAVRVDGVDVRELSREELCSRIGYVPQKSVLFSGTIASNITYGKTNATEAQMKEAAAIAQAADFIEEKEQGYESPIAQGGTNVSGGQRQRLSIARAIAKEPEILIFDDSFSALDFKTDAALRKALKERTGDVTTLIVAQRISTILHADRILVLDEGRVAGMGTHQELMETCEVYRQIATSQLSSEELGA